MKMFGGWGGTEKKGQLSKLAHLSIKSGIPCTHTINRRSHAGIQHLALPQLMVSGLIRHEAWRGFAYTVLI